MTLDFHSKRASFAGESDSYNDGMDKPIVSGDAMVARRAALYRRFVVAVVAGMAALLLLVATGCGSAPQQAGGKNEPLVLTDRAVIRDENFGGVYFDLTADEFEELGFSFGDSVDVVFSNGYEMQDIPYYNGYYVRAGNQLIVGYPGYPHIMAAINYGDSLWEVAGLKEGDSATITLREAGKNRAVQEAFDISYTNVRSEYPSDEAFANYRSLSGGAIMPDVFFRSASPVCDDYDRASYVNRLMEQSGVSFVLNLSDNEEEIDAFLEDDAQKGTDVSYFTSLMKAGNVAAIDNGASYSTQEYASRLVGGLNELTEHDGPYLIHCIEGKDRTGFVCALLEALSGATYDEIANDYMLTYENYYHFTKEKDPDKYQAILELNLDGMLMYLAGAQEGDDLRSIDYVEAARNYLRGGGMSDEQIDRLVERLTQSGT